MTSQHTGRGSHPNNGGDKIKSSNLYFWCIKQIKQIHFRSGLPVVRTIQTNCDLQVLLVNCSTCFSRGNRPKRTSFRFQKEHRIAMICILVGVGSLAILIVIFQDFHVSHLFFSAPLRFLCVVAVFQFP